MSLQRLIPDHSTSTTTSPAAARYKTFRDPSICKSALVWQCPALLVHNTKRNNPSYLCRCKLDHDQYYTEQFKTALQQYTTLRSRSEPDWDSVNLLDGDPWGYMYDTLEKLEREVDTIEEQGMGSYGRIDLYRDFKVTDEEFNILEKGIKSLYQQADLIIDTTLEVQSHSIDIILDQIKGLEEQLILKLGKLAQNQVVFIIEYYKKRQSIYPEVIEQLTDDWKKYRGLKKENSEQFNDKNGQNDDSNNQNFSMMDSTSTLTAESAATVTPTITTTNTPIHPTTNSSISTSAGKMTNNELITNRNDDKGMDETAAKDENDSKNNNKNDDRPHTSTSISEEKPPIFTKIEIADKIDDLLPRPPQIVDISQFTQFRWDFFDPSDTYYNALNELPQLVSQAINGMKYQLCITCCGLSNLQEERQRNLDHLCGKFHTTFRDIREQILLYTKTIKPLTIPNGHNIKPHLIHSWYEWGHRYVPATEAELKQLQSRGQLYQEATNKLQILSTVGTWGLNGDGKNIHIHNSNNNSLQINQDQSKNDQNISQQTILSPESMSIHSSNTVLSIETHQPAIGVDFGYNPDDQWLLLDPSMVLAIESIQPYTPFNHNIIHSTSNPNTSEQSLARRDDMGNKGNNFDRRSDQNDPNDYHVSEQEAFRRYNQRISRPGIDKDYQSRDTYTGRGVTVRDDRSGGASGRNYYDGDRGRDRGYNNRG